MRVITFGQKQHQVTVVQEKPNLDLAVLKFTAQEDYKNAKSKDCDDVRGGADIYAFGYPSNLGANNDFYRFAGSINSDTSINFDSTFKYTYKSYISTKMKGMSGGLILNNEGYLVGVDRGIVQELSPDGRIVPEVGTYTSKYTGLQVGIAIKPNLENIEEMISKAKEQQTIAIVDTQSEVPTNTKTNSETVENQDLVDTQSEVPTNTKTNPETDKNQKKEDDPKTQPDTITIQYSPFKPEEKEAISIINSMFQVQRQKLKDDNFRCLEENDCDDFFINSGYEMERQGVKIPSENYNFAFNKTTRGVFHYAVPKANVNPNLKGFVGAVFLSNTATRDHPETMSIICFTNNLVETPYQMPRPNYNSQKEANFRLGTFNITAESSEVNTPSESSEVNQEKPVQLSSIFIADVCKSDSKEPSQKRDEALNFLQKPISENQLPIWINFAQKWRKDSDILLKEPEYLFITNACRYYEPKNKPNQKEAFQVLQSAINNLSSEVQFE